MGRALETLNAYTMNDAEQSAFLEHGTPLPVQGYLFNELWNKKRRITEYLTYFYPRLKRYYNYLGGGEKVRLPGNSDQTLFKPGTSFIIQVDGTIIVRRYIRIKRNWRK